MDAERLSQLIGLIYDSAVDLHLWPLLLQGLAEELESQASPRESSGTDLQAARVESIERLGEYVNRWYGGEFSGEDKPNAQLSVHQLEAEEGRLMEILLPHFSRALNMNRQFLEMKAEHRAFSSVLERLPIGMAMTDARGRVMAKNKRFDALLKQDCGLAISQGHLAAIQRDDNRALAQLITESLESATGENPSSGRAMRLNGAIPASLLVVPIPQDGLLPMQPRVMVFVTSLIGEVGIEPKALQAFFGLTKAESRLTLALVRGSDLDSIAEEFHVSKHTLRTQLKSVYSKTECKRQAELVVKVLTSPAILSGETVDLHEPPRFHLPLDTGPNGSREEQYLFLSDGRRLCYAEFGPEDGYPVIMMHGVTGSRLQISPERQCLGEQGLRIIIPDRPGFGFSDSLDERSIYDWHRDVTELVDALGLERFALLGYSVGGSFALAAAKALQARVSRLTLVSPMGHFRDIKDLDGMLPMFRILLGLGRYTPNIAMALVRIIGRSIRNNAERYYERVIEQSPQMDREVLGNRVIRDLYTQSMLEAARQGERDMIMEQLMMARDWGFEVEDITVPITIWHGEEDRHVPLGMARELQKKLPDAELKVIPGAGHFLIFKYWTDIITDLSSRLQTA